MAGHTGQSSQLFPVTTGRNAQFLATVPTLVGRFGWRYIAYVVSAFVIPIVTAVIATVITNSLAKQ
jgi:hypothetical protein